MLFIEGTKDDTNGNLREGFHKLLEQKLEGSMPRIKMGNGVSTTIRVFKNNYRSKRFSEKSYLLIDLDKNESKKEETFNKYKLRSKKEKVFFMIQEMEGWFISQPNILDEFYCENISHKIKNKSFKKFNKPAEYLKKLTANNKKKTYHKVRHGVELLKMLDANQLYIDSSEFKSLIDRLK